jgi:predicted GH43/DUF377 family glycosyl hydrolase
MVMGITKLVRKTKLKIKARIKIKAKASSTPKVKAKVSSPVYHLTYKGKYFKFVLGKRKGAIKVAMSSDLKSWEFLEKATLKSRLRYFDEQPIGFLGAFLITEGIFLLYFVENPFSVGAVLYDSENPEVLRWRSANPLYQSDEKLIPEKVSLRKRDIVLYIKKRTEKKVRRVLFSLDYLLINLAKKSRAFKAPTIFVERSMDNPIIQPHEAHRWENYATFNTAALYLEGRVHLLYRAIGDQGMSVLGYASSQDGIHVDERLSSPVYVPQEPFEFKRERDGVIKFDYASGGGGWGGCEDPRLTCIDDTVYMLYTAFNGAEPPGVAMTAITVRDFLRHQWRWRRPVLLSPRGEIHKNWALFPEKINGQYAILHSISPKILISYFDHLNFTEDVCIKSHHASSEVRNGGWDNQLRGMGPPPIKVSDGWLVLYHAMDKRDPNRYKIGAMILDEEDPTRVRYKAASPVLAPDMHYENNGHKGGVVYTCGAVVIKDQLFIYYGGADTVTCIATAELSQFLAEIKKTPIS